MGKKVGTANHDIKRPIVSQPLRGNRGMRQSLANTILPSLGQDGPQPNLSPWPAASPTKDQTNPTRRNSTKLRKEQGKHPMLATHGVNFERFDGFP